MRSTKVKVRHCYSFTVENFTNNHNLNNYLSNSRFSRETLYLIESCFIVNKPKIQPITTAFVLNSITICVNMIGSFWRVESYHSVVVLQSI